MKVIPTQDRILVKRVQNESKTAGGIMIPDNAKEKPIQGEVIAVGTGARTSDGTLVPLDLKVGDIVFFTKWSGTEIKVNGEDLLVMKESDVIAIVK